MLDTTELPCPTPHIKAKKGDFAKTVLLPGDPKRAEFIAKNFLTNPVLVNDVRGVQGYTGEYKGKKVSVMGSGMGLPSIAIYSYELYHGFGVENIIRVGSAGSMHPDLNLRDIMVATGACTNSRYDKNFNLNGTISAVASFELLKKCEEAVKKVNCGKKVMFGQIFSADNFYTDKKGETLQWAKMGVLGVEMESYALYLNAARCGKKALTICTISDHLMKEEYLDSDERTTGFTDMIKIALETAVSLED